MKWAQDAVHMGEATPVMVFIEKRERKRPFGGARRRWQYNINMDLK
jgi:hypothetical protein